MENNRPLQNLTDAELLSLWKRATAIDEMGQTTLGHIGGYCYDSLITDEDIEYIRAGVLLMAKLCDKYGIPHPPVRLGLGAYEPELSPKHSDFNEDEEDEYEREVFEYMREDLHITMDSFACIDGIGDFVEEDLFYDPEILEPMLVGDSDEEEKAEAGKFLTDEMEYSGYREVIEFIRDTGYDMVDVEELKVTKSKKMESLIKLISNGTVPGDISSFMDEFTTRVFMRTCYWVPMNELEEVKDDTWCCVSTILNHYEDGMIIGDLYKHMSIRIGAYIAQEFADRYAA